MKTNSDITIYNKYIVAATRTEAYQRTQVQDVAWESRKAANVLATGGNLAADAARIFIPFARDEDYLDPKAWQALSTKTGKWTLQVGDIIVKGLISTEISGATTITTLKNTYDNVLIITSVDTMDMGSESMQHWQVGAR